MVDINPSALGGRFIDELSEQPVRGQHRACSGRGKGLQNVPAGGADIAVSNAVIFHRYSMLWQKLESHETRFFGDIVVCPIGRSLNDVLRHGYEHPL